MGTKFNQSRGWRNCNPLNLRKSANKWVGMKPTQEDKAFVQFVCMSYGYRAAIKTLQSYYTVMRTLRRDFNIRNIIKRWAPASDGNNPEGYACKVGEWTGIDVDRILPEPRSIEGKWPFIRIMAAMTRVECGVPKDKLPWKDIEKGWELAYGEKE